MRAFIDFINIVAMQSGRRQAEAIVEVARQRAAFAQDNPSLAEKRKKALEYLGDKWILAKKHERITPKGTQQ